MVHKVLAIETSCDDTSMGIVCSDGDGFWVEDLRTASSVADHQQYGGVVPEIASRRHSEDIIPLVEAIWYDTIKTVDAIAVTTHPGLPGSLTVGKAMASMLGEWFHKPIVPINHIHGHIFSVLLERKKSDLPCPWVVLSVSGGHNDLYLVEEWGETVGSYIITRLGGTLDDASGEAFDKVARMLGGPYPWGPWISQKVEEWLKVVKDSWRLLKEGEKMQSSYHFPRVFLWGEKNRWNFSFSGLKGQCHRYVEQQWEMTEAFVQEVAYEFQEAVVEVLAKKLVKAGIEYGAKTLAIVGGVSANARLWKYAQEYVAHKWLDVQLVRPMKIVYSTDNSAMIGVVGLMSV